MKNNIQQDLAHRTKRFQTPLKEHLMIRRSIQVILGRRPRLAALHRVGRSPARTLARIPVWLRAFAGSGARRCVLRIPRSLFEFPAHPSSLILRDFVSGDPEDDEEEEEEEEKPEEGEEEEEDDGKEQQVPWQVEG